MKTLTFILSLLLALNASAATYTVDQRSGHDTNPGTPEAPFVTLAKAMEAAQGGDTILLMPGEYGEINYRGQPDEHLYTGDYLTIKPDPSVEEPWEEVSIAKVTFGPKGSHMVDTERRGAYDINVAIEGVRIVDGVSQAGGRNLKLIGCRIERIGPWVGSKDNIEKFAVVTKAGSNILIENCDITNTAGGLTLSSWNVVARGNKIHNITHDGIRCVSLKDSLIENNEIFNLDDGVEDDDPRGKGWNRHCDAIHIFIPGPAKSPIARNSNIIIRGNRMWNCESQAMQFNNYLRVKDLWNENIIIENNIFGPTRANVINIADPVDGIIVRNNTFVYFPEGRTFRGLGRDIFCDNHTFRITPRCKNAQVYNNIFHNSFEVSPGWFVANNVVVDPPHHTMPTRKDIVLETITFTEPEALDGKLPPDSPAINAGTRLAPAGVYEKDFYGTPRDLRPDAGAYELPGQSPAAEPPFPRLTGEPRIFVEDFKDGNLSTDPWLNGNAQTGMSWSPPAGQKPWKIKNLSRDGLLPGLSSQGFKGDSWMISQSGDDWADMTLTLNVRNAYNKSGAGILLRGNANTEGYLINLADGSVTVRKQDSAGKMHEQVLVTGENLLPRVGAETYVISIKDGFDGTTITVDKGADGNADITALDPEKHLKAGSIALYNHSHNGSHRTDIVDIRVDLERKGAS